LKSDKRTFGQFEAVTLMVDERMRWEKVADPS